MAKQNCWEAKRCGKEATCPAALERRLAGVHQGRNGGRACWVVPGTLCGGAVQGKFAMKLSGCLACSFYLSVRAEEGANMASPRELVERVR